jgi:AI-2 transport protein TqsA
MSETIGEKTPRHSGSVGGSVALRNAAVFIAVAIGGYTLRYLHAIVTPLVIAIFLLLLIDGFSRTLERRFPAWPDWFRLGLGAVLTIAGFVVIVGICAENARPFGAQIIVLQPKIDALLGRLSDALQIPELSVGDLFRRGDAAGSMTHALGAARGVVSEAFLVVIYLGFLLASRQAFGRKTQRMFVTHEVRTHAERVFSRVRSASEQYIGLQTLKAALVAGVAWAIMGVLGVSNALFLAFLLFLAAYVPIVGGIAGAIVPSLLALAQFESPLRPLILFVSLGATIFLIENVLMPKLQSDRLNLDPVFILLSLGFWGIILGLPGALLSTPLTVVVMAIASEFSGTRWLALLLSKDGELTIRETDPAAAKTG